MTPQTQNPHSVVVTNISKRFYQQPVLSRINFSVGKGRSYVILGQSGIGKSVLLKILAGLIIPDEGHVSLSTRNVGMLFQKNALFDSLTVHNNLDFPLRERLNLSKSERDHKIKKFLEWVDLAGTGNLYPEELSGGMQKRLGIARALIVEPELLLYDEPTAGLDPITSRLIADLILRLKRELGTTIIAVTSDIMRAFQLADELGLLVRGANGATLLPAGTPDQARASTDAAIQQFLKGLTKGPLTADPEPTKRIGDAYFECGMSLTEKIDVDYF